MSSHTRFARRFARAILPTLFVVPLFSYATQAAHAAAATFTRFPSSSATQLAFVAHDDLWVAPRDGGGATRLVQGDGRLAAARFSPDGRWIAYTRRARGGQDVFVVAAAGGMPRRLTFDARRSAAANLVVAWTPDSARIVFLSDRQSVSSKQIQAFSVPVAGGQATRLPLGQAGTLAYAPDGAAIAYTRTFTDLASRKRYTGGQAEDLFVLDVASKRGARITDWKGTDTAPMWWGRQLYFLSDRGPGWRLNLWRYDMDSKAATQVTHFTDYDIDWPALNAGRITFQQGAALWALDVPGERLHKLDVSVPDDGAQTAPRTIAVGRQARATDVTGAVDYALAGSTALLSAHGDIFQVGLADGQARNLTTTPGVAEQHPVAAPDGRLLAYITEDDKAQQLAVRPLAGGPERRLTRFAAGVLYQPRFSPDGRWLLVASAQQELWLVPVDGGAALRIVFDPKGEIRDATFAADGRSIAYSTLRQTGLSALHLYDIATQHDAVLSNTFDGDRLPAFSADGATLYFVSRRHERVLTSDRGDEATLATVASDGIYALDVRQAGTRAAPMDGAYAVPVAGGRIVSLALRGTELFYETRPLDLLAGDDPSGQAQLHALDPRTGQDRIVLRDLDNHVLAPDGRIVLFRRNGQWQVQDAAPGATGQARPVDLAQLTMRVEPRAQWREMFEHAWRLDRDLFFSRVMNGSDWQAVHDAYARLLPLVGSRTDMLYLLQQLQGELATSHAFIGGADADGAAAPLNTPRLGADLVPDPDSGRYRLAQVYRGDPTRARFRSPLNAPDTGVRIDAGTYLLGIDGVDLRVPQDPDSLLAGKGAEITLTVADTPGGAPRTVKVRTVRDDTELRLHAWIAANRARVAARSGNRVGYLFVSDFASLGAEDLLRQLQGQLDKDGLVIDVRWNGGGFTSQAVLGLLRRVHAGVFVNRNGALEPLPLFVAPRAMAVVTNEASASDGDQFPYFFRAYGLGPVVGQRTWGGVQGIKGLAPLMDGIGITIPKDSLASTDGHWLIENEGVAPDIAVAPQADDLLDGNDRALDTAVDTVLGKIARAPAESLRAPPALPAYPAGGDIAPDSFATGLRRN
jgi:tricorn protease